MTPGSRGPNLRAALLPVGKTSAARARGGHGRSESSDVAPAGGRSIAGLEQLWRFRHLNRSIFRLLRFEKEK